jgi:hypothetical protein
MSETWPTLEICTSGRVGFEEQHEILSKLIDKLKHMPVAVVHVDHSIAEIEGTTEEARDFGQRFGEAMQPFEKVFFAIFVGNEARVAPLVDVSVMIAKKFGIQISTFNDFDRLVLRTSRHLTDLI